MSLCEDETYSSLTANLFWGAKQAVESMHSTRLRKRGLQPLASPEPSLCLIVILAALLLICAPFLPLHFQNMLAVLLHLGYYPPESFLFSVFAQSFLSAYAISSFLPSIISVL